MLKKCDIEYDEHYLWECFSRPCGTKKDFARQPTLERVGYSQFSPPGRILTKISKPQGRHLAARHFDLVILYLLHSSEPHIHILRFLSYGTVRA